MRALWLLPLTLAACVEASPETAAPDPLADLPPGVSREDVYTRQPDPRAGPCYYYRVEGLEVLHACLSQG